MSRIKFIVVTGGVLSGLGKGVAAASIGNLLTASGAKVVPVKCDGYLNVDPGTMNPVEHGEVFVLDDGGEVDMDFGHYERYLNFTCSFDQSLTMGKVFDAIRKKERRGDYLGKTVQFIPHVTNYIKEYWEHLAKKNNADFLVIEVGGTVGDIEAELYLEAARQLKFDHGKDSVMYVHLTYVPIPSNVKEQKSKPTQQSVASLRERGITPNMIISRCREYLTPKIRRKIAIFCDVPEEAVISGVDLKNVYEIPLNFYKQGVLDIVNKHFGELYKPNLDTWKNLVESLESPSEEVVVALCGKYIDLEDSYASIIEALHHVEANLGCKITIKWIDTSDTENYSELLKGVDAVIVPGGFGTRGIEGKINVVQYCREHDIPFLGICYGMQLAVIEYARNKCGLIGAHTTEVDENTKHPVVCILPEQLQVEDLGGTMRLGGHDIEIKQNTMAHELFGDVLIRRRFRHRYEVNPEYIPILEDHGVVFSGKAPKREIMQVMELPGHSYFVGGQFHPELTSSLLHPAPMFVGLIRAVLKKKGGFVGKKSGKSAA